ncbi:MAG TPA: lyase family protein, partial [Dehalococcoidia bacterium]|nr:lyase family protein [Dehalococcoidia bacterium]
WMGSGPRAGLGELALPEVQPGSSIMPGKVNPVIAESLIMVGAQVLGHDTAIATSGQWGYFELNTMLPVATWDLLDSIELLAKAAENFAVQCVDGIQATARGPEMVEKGLAICTSLAPEIGYDAAAAIAKEADKTGRTIREVALERTNLTPADLDRILNPEEMVKPGLGGGPAGG